MRHPLPPAYVLGGSQTDFALKYSSLAELLSLSTFGALEDAGISHAEIDVIHVGNLLGEVLSGQAHLGAMVTSLHRDFHGLPSSRHEAACASGSVAVAAALAQLGAGLYDVALVVGAEVLRTVPGADAGRALGCAAWAGRELEGEEYPWPAQFALVADEYARRWGLTHEPLGRIAEINMDNAKRNPNAQTRDWVHQSCSDDDSSNPLVRGMLRKQDCGRITDGAAAVVLASPRFAREWARRSNRDLASVPRITGFGHRTAPLALADKLPADSQSGVLFPHISQAFNDALGRANLPDVGSLDVLEVHDCFSISEYVAIDHVGLTAPGASWQAVEDGTIAMDGSLPINPSGGLLGLGHPVGATGVRMLLDCANQVSDRAGDYQVAGARRAATLNIGGSFTTVVSFIVEDERD